MLRTCRCQVSLVHCHETDPVLLQVALVGAALGDHPGDEFGMVVALAQPDRVAPRLVGFDLHEAVAVHADVQIGHPRDVVLDVSVTDQADAPIMTRGCIIHDPRRVVLLELGAKDRSAVRHVGIRCPRRVGTRCGRVRSAKPESLR